MGKKEKFEKKPISVAIPIFKRVIRYVWTYKGLALICVVMSVVISLLHFTSLSSVKPLGDVLFGDKSEALLQKLSHLGKAGEWLADFLYRYVFQDRYRALFIVMVFILTLMVIKDVLRFFQEYLTAYISEKMSIDIANDLYNKVIGQSVGFFGKKGPGEVAAHFTNDIPMISSGIKSIFGKVIREPLKAVGSLVLAMVINWKLTLVALGVFPLAGYFLNRLGKDIRKGAKKSLSKQANILSNLQEDFSGIKVIKAYQMESFSKDNVNKEYQKLLGYAMKVHKAEAATSPIMEIFITASGVGMLMLSGHLVLSGQMTTGDFCAFYAALGTMFDPIRKLADLNNRINSCVAAGERVFPLMDHVPEIQEKPGAISASPLSSKLEFNEISFCYEPGEEVLKNISFNVSHGETIALVGPSGAGKSTLVSLIPRFYDATKGSIKIDGMDIKDITLNSLRSQIGIVTQEAFLFNDTISNNIAYGRRDATREEIYEAARMAYADEFILSLPHGYDTIYGEGGIGLSGGQKHRIALARAILKNPKILILDEAMANLDAESEHYIKKALEVFTKNRTTFIIAHRFSTIEKADKILVLCHGVMEGLGTPAQMLAESPTYSNLYRRQQQGMEIFDQSSL